MDHTIEKLLAQAEMGDFAAHLELFELGIEVELAPSTPEERAACDIDWGALAKLEAAADAIANGGGSQAEVEALLMEQGYRRID